MTADASLRVFVTVDIGPDDAVLGRGHASNGEWSRTEAGLTILRDVFRSIEDDSDTRVVATWLLRADRLMAEQFSDRLSVFKRFASFTEERVSQGHELGWMPQVYAAKDDEIHYHDLEVTYEAIGEWGEYPRSVRMGDCFHDNRTMRTLSELGVPFDSSAVPGRKKDDAGWRMDWIGTPDQAYHPSLQDYREPGTPCLQILELPLSVLPIAAPYDAAPLVRYLNPCIRRDYLWPSLRKLVASSAYLICVLHPDEVLPHRAGHPLISYSADELRFNLRELIGEATRLGRTVSFHVLEEFSN